MNYPRVILWVRRSQLYFHGQNDHTDSTTSLSMRYKTLVNAWNLFLKMGYGDFREKIIRIAEETYRPNQFDSIFFWNDWQIFDHLPEGAWVIPVDDDDWLSPFLVDTIQGVIKDHDESVLKWDTLTINQSGLVYIFSGTSRLYRSCSYAVKLPFNRSSIGWCVNMSRSNPSSCYRVPQILAAKVDNFSSVSWLWSPQLSIEVFLRLMKERPLVGKTEVSSVFHPMINKYNEVLSELYDSCRI